MFRTVGAGRGRCVERLAPLAAPASRSRTCSRSRRCGCDTVPGLRDGGRSPFTTDIPFLERWGQPLLFGPGSILVAHTDDEHVAIAELEAAVDAYVAIARELLRQSASS